MSIMITRLKRLCLGVYLNAIIIANHASGGGGGMVVCLVDELNVINFEWKFFVKLAFMGV